MSETLPFFVEQYHYHGEPCKKCNSIIRYIKGAGCVLCRRKSKRKWNKKNHGYVSKWREENKNKQREYASKWREKNLEYANSYREKNLERASKWRDENKDAIQEYSRNYREKNPEYANNYRKENKDAIQEYSRNYREKNPDKMHKNRQKRRARLANNKHEPYNFSEICERHNNICLACGAIDVKLTVDHIIPVSKGGADAEWNIQPLCLSCNMNKGNRHNTNYIVPQAPSFDIATG